MRHALRGVPRFNSVTATEVLSISCAPYISPEASPVDMRIVTGEWYSRAKRSEFDIGAPKRIPEAILDKVGRSFFLDLFWI